MMTLRTAILVTMLAAGVAASPAALDAQTKPASKPAAAAAKAARTIEIKGTDDMKFSVTTIAAKPGETLRIVLTTVSSMPKMVMAHNWLLLKKEADVQAFINASALARDSGFVAPAKKGDVIAGTGLAGGGEKVEVTFTVPKVAGAYPFVCSFPGHWAAGMKGTLTVK
jgi:azurin